MNLVRCTPSDEILVAYITDMTMQKKVVTKKGHQIFGQEKCIPAEKSLATPMSDIALRHVSTASVVAKAKIRLKRMFHFTAKRHNVAASYTYLRAYCSCYASYIKRGILTKQRRTKLVQQRTPRHLNYLWFLLPI